jgi:hypothetical protein
MCVCVCVRARACVRLFLFATAACGAFRPLGGTRSGRASPHDVGQHGHTTDDAHDVEADYEENVAHLGLLLTMRVAVVEKRVGMMMTRIAVIVVVQVAVAASIVFVVFVFVLVVVVVIFGVFCR